MRPQTQEGATRRPKKDTMDKHEGENMSLNGIGDSNPAENNDSYNSQSYFIKYIAPIFFVGGLRDGDVELFFHEARPSFGLKFT